MAGQLGIAAAGGQEPGQDPHQRGLARAVRPQQRDDLAALDRVVVTDRRAFDVRCDALLIDLRGKERPYPQLASRASYAFTQRLGRYVHEQDQNGLLVRSARCDGINGCVFKPQRLSNVRHRAYLTYRVNPARDTFVAERARGRKWLALAPSTLG